jgi:YD repeat-containing protein
VTPSYGATTVPKLPDGKDIAVLCKQVEQPTLDANGSQGLSAAVNTAQLSSTLKYTYTQYGQVLTSVDARGNTTNYAYYCQDGQYSSGTNNHEFTGTAPNEVGHYQGDLWKVTNAKAHVTEYTQYDRAGRPLSMLDPNGLVTTYAYWPRGWIKSVTVGSQATSYDYWPTGLLKKVTQPDSSYLTYTYDDAHRLTDVTDNLGNTVHYTLDNAGNRKAEDVKDIGGTLTRNISRVYDALNRLENVTGAAQ